MHAYADQAVNVMISHSKARWDDPADANVCFVVSTARQPVTKSGVDR